MKTLIACLFFTWALTGCTVSLDPLGMTERTAIRANAAVQIEQQRTIAAQAAAQATVDAEAERQAGENHRAATWAMILPVLGLVAGATVILAFVVNWKGRIAHEQLRLQYTQQPTVVYLEAQPRSEYQLMRDYARGWGGELAFQDGLPVVMYKNGFTLPIKRDALPGGQRLLGGGL